MWIAQCLKLFEFLSEFPSPSASLCLSSGKNSSRKGVSISTPFVIQYHNQTINQSHHEWGVQWVFSPSKLSPCFVGKGRASVVLRKWQFQRNRTLRSVITAVEILFGEYFPWQSLQSSHKIRY